MEMITTTHSAAPVWATERVRKAPPISTVQGSGLPFAGSAAGYGAGRPAFGTAPMTLGVVANTDDLRVPARGRPL